MTDLWSRFEHTARTNAERPALLVGDEACSFREWRARADDYRHAYRAHRVGSSDRVLLWVSNTLDMAAALTAAWAEGAIATLMDASAPASHLLHAVERTSPKLVVTTGERGLPCVLDSGTPCVSHRDVGPQPAAAGSGTPRLPTDMASIVFTSGSTGKPKGVVQTHGNLMRGCEAVRGYLGLTQDDRLLCTVPWSFDYGFGQLLSTVLFGVTHIVPKPSNPSGICAAIEAHRPTVLGGLASVYGYLLSGLSPIRTTDTSSLRLLMNTGGAIHKGVLADMLEVFAHCEIVLNYGLTETYRSCYLPAPLVRERHDSIGIPIPGADIVIVGEDGRVLPPGEEGEIVHRGDFICLGYWNDPEATARAVRADPVSVPGAPNPGRALYTGDYGCRTADGFVYFRGRRDHQLKSMGVRVSPHEVEELLFASGSVTEAAVFGMPHDLLGHEVWAAIVPACESASVEAEIQRYARRVMSQYMQPRRYLLQTKLPRTTSGKVDYPALKRLAAAVPSAGRS